MSCIGYRSFKNSSFVSFVWLKISMSVDFDLPVKRNNCAPSVRMPQEYVTASLPDWDKSDLVEGLNDIFA